MKSAVGIMLLAGSPLSGYLVSALGPNLYVELVWSRSISEADYILIQHGPFLALTAVGFVLYIAGRKEFWKSVDKHQVTLWVLVALGAFLLVWGLFGSFVEYSIILYYSHKPPPGKPFVQSLVKYSPPLLWFVLSAISGIFLVADGNKALGPIKVVTQTKS